MSKKYRINLWVPKFFNLLDTMTYGYDIPLFRIIINENEDDFPGIIDNRLGTSCCLPKKLDRETLVEAIATLLKNRLEIDFKEDPNIEELREIAQGHADRLIKMYPGLLSKNKKGATDDD